MHQDTVSSDCCWQSWVLAVMFSDHNELRILRAGVVCSDSIPKAVCKPRKGEKLPNPVKWTYWAQYVTPLKQLWRCTHRKGRSSAEDLKCRHYFWTVVFGFSFPKVTNGWSLGKGGGRKVKKKLQRNQCWTLGNVICSWCWRSTYKMMQVRRNKLLPSLFPEKLFSNCSRGTLSSCAVRNNMHMLILMQEGTALLLLF